MSTTGNTISDFQNGVLLLDETSPPSTYTLYEFDMSSYVGQTVYFGIRYKGDYAWYMWADDFTFPDGTTEGFEPPGGFPPTGWTIQSISTETWEEFTYSSYPWTRCYEIYGEAQDEWLISPTISVG